MSKVILRLPAVQDQTGFSRSTIERLEKQGKFPARVRLSENSVGWYADEIQAFLSSRARVVRKGQPPIYATTPATKIHKRKSDEH